MSNTARISPARTRRPLKYAFWLKFAGVAAVILLALGASVGVGQSPASRPSDDVMQLRVQSALDNDAVLKPYRLALLVNVVDRQAVIGGPVPNASIAAQLKSVAKKVPGIVGVRVNVWVPSSLMPDDPLSRKVAELMKPEPPLAAVPPPTPRVVSPTPPPVVVPPAEVKPVARPKLAPAPEPAGNSVSNKGPDGLLLDPVAPQGTGFRPTPHAPGAARLPYATIPPPNVPALPPRSEHDAVPTAPEYTPVDAPPAAPKRVVNDLESLRKDPRYVGLRVELQDGVAIISGRATGGTEIRWSLAQAVRKLPGVERVVVRQP